MLPHLNWLHAHAAKLEPGLRRHIFNRLRPPRWLPCLLHAAWSRLMGRLRHVSLILDLAEGEGHVASLMATADLQILHHLDLVGAIAVRLPLGHIPKICEHAGVRRIWHDDQVHLPMPVHDLGDQAGTQVEDPARAALGLSALHQRGLTGEQITIAIVDTGVYPHADLQDRISGFKDLVAGQSHPYDDNGHGTHCAGLALGSGSGSGGRYVGAAPTAKLVAVKALTKEGSAQLSGIIAAVQWVVQTAPQYGTRVLSLSLGGPANGAADQDPMARAVTAAWDAGLVVVCAAGNEGPQPQTISTPGIAPAVVTVGAMDDHSTPARDDDTLADFSSRGPTPDGHVKPDLLAPGVGVVSLRSPGSYLDKQLQAARVGDLYFRLSGTSMATPLVAGVAACLVQQNTKATPAMIRQELLHGCEDQGLAPNEQGAGYLDCHRLFNA